MSNFGFQVVGFRSRKNKKLKAVIAKNSQLFNLKNHQKSSNLTPETFLFSIHVLLEDMSDLNII